MTEPLLRLEDLRADYRVRRGLFGALTHEPQRVVQALDGVDLELQRGEIVALVGESGSGKTTLGRVIVKLTRQSSGRVVFDGSDVSDVWAGASLGAYRRRVQMVFQDPFQTLSPRQRVFDSVVEPLLVQRIGTDRADRQRRVYEALEAAGLSPAARFVGRYPHQLSGGQRQRVAIAGALAIGPDLLVADEPVSMLDVTIRSQILRLMLDLRDRHRLTFLFITHDLPTAWMIADRIAVLYLGRIVELGPAEEVFRNPQHPYSRALINVSPRPTPGADRTTIEQSILRGEVPSAAAIPAGCRFNPRCPLAFDRCRVGEPPLIRVGDGHQAACWLASP